MVLNYEIVKFKDLTIDDKRMFLNKYFVYEVNMLISSYRFILESNQTKNQFFKNISLECFVMHARVLRDFFNSKNKKYEDDALAIDFLKDDNNFYEFIDSNKEIFDYLKNKSNKQAVHLTYTRMTIELNNKSWDARKVITELLKIVLEFLNNLNETFLFENISQLKYDINDTIIKQKLNITI